MLKSINRQSKESMESVLKKKRKTEVGDLQKRKVLGLE